MDKCIVSFGDPNPNFSLFTWKGKVLSRYVNLFMLWSIVFFTVMLGF